MRSLIALVALAALGLAGALGAIYLGLPDVAATTPHWSITEWVLATTMERSVRRRGRDISVPGDLSDPGRVRAGAIAYDDMCAECHAAPGIEAGVLAKGLLPEPPELREKAGEWSAGELFWITKHGIRMTGMPAFGPTHSDREIWDVLAFLERMHGMSASEYHALTDGRRGHPAHEPAQDRKSETGHTH